MIPVDLIPDGRLPFRACCWLSFTRIQNLSPTICGRRRCQRDYSWGAEDLAPSPRWPTRRFYPIEMVRAVAMVWLFSGLRSDEIVRLRVGCATTKVLDEQRGKTVSARGADE